MTVLAIMRLSCVPVTTSAPSLANRSAAAVEGNVADSVVWTMKNSSYWSCS